MLDVHPPHETTHTWKDFFIHIATIVVGLLIAIGLEQTVEAIHNHHARHQLLEDIHEELVTNQENNRLTQHNLTSLRAYLVALNRVLMDRRAGKPNFVDPAMEKGRQYAGYGSSMAAWQSAKESGRASLLPGKQIRLYDRFNIQLEHRHEATTRLDQAAGEMQAFEERFRDARSFMLFGFPSSTPDLSAMSPADLTQYSTLVATTIQNLDRLAARTAVLDGENTALLNGATNEEDLIKIAFKDVNVRIPLQDDPATK